MNRPKRSNRGQPVFDQTKRRKPTNTAGKKRSTAQVSQVDNDSGTKGRVALEHTIVVGRVYIQRMERAGTDRRDVGRTPREPG